MTDLNSQQLRTRLREAREKLGAAERIGAAQAVLASLESLPEFLVDKAIAGYWAVRGEVPLNLVYARTRSREQTYHLPILTEHKALVFAPWQNGDAVTINRYGISEPNAAKAVDASNCSSWFWCRCSDSIAAAIVWVPARVITIARSRS